MSSAVGDKIVLGGGAGILLGESTLCTMAAVGHDSTGRLIGFTAANCGGAGAPVVVEGAEDHGAVGTVVATDEHLGYAVIELDAAKVKPISDYEGFGIFGLWPPEPDPEPDTPASPNPEPATAEPANPEPAAPQPEPEPVAQQACKLGRGTGLNCFAVGPVGVDTTAEQWWQPGDDGSPVTVANLLIGMVRDATVPITPLDQPGPGIVMFKAILDDVNAKGGPGAGFGLG